MKKVKLLLVTYTRGSITVGNWDKGVVYVSPSVYDVLLLTDSPKNTKLSFLGENVCIIKDSYIEEGKCYTLDDTLKSVVASLENLIKKGENI